VNALEVTGLSVSYGSKGSPLPAVRDVSLAVPAGRTLGLVGESGSGKSTLAKAIVGLERPERGTVSVHGRPVGHDRAGLRHLRRSVQLVFQDPNASLNPRLTVRSALLEAASLLPEDERMAVDELLELVSLSHQVADRFPHQLSGGQRQRVAIARVLAVRPSVLIADEITASLDVSVQANVLNLLGELQRNLSFACLFISHSLAVVRHVSDDVAVMYLGRVVEYGTAEQVFSRPAHPYTRALLDAVPRRRRRDTRPARLSGDIPDPREAGTGCVFHGRCPVGPAHLDGRTTCTTEPPVLLEVGAGPHRAACHYPLTGSPRPEDRPAPPGPASTMKE
jgi:peptide/nickel transport system ATP-binding protein